jgi:rubrerythrin
MSTPLSERQQRLLLLFRQAIGSEQEAQRMYSEMLLTCDDQELRRVIESLRAAEVAHEEVLVGRYADLKHGGDAKD